MVFRYALRTADGDDADEVDLDRHPNVGDAFRLMGRRLRVRAVVPFELRLFVNEPIVGFLVVEPIDE
jgi:hypothetical protein